MPVCRWMLFFAPFLKVSLHLIHRIGLCIRHLSFVDPLLYNFSFDQLGTSDIS